MLIYAVISSFVTGAGTRYMTKSLNFTVGTVLICFVALYIAVQFCSLSDKTQHQKSFIFLFSRNISLNSSSTTLDRHDKSQFYHTAPRSWWLEVEVRFMNCDCNLSHVIRQLELKQILQK